MYNVYGVAVCFLLRSNYGPATHLIVMTLESLGVEIRYHDFETPLSSIAYQAVTLISLLYLDTEWASVCAFVYPEKYLGT